jgi:hypothetical protein
MFTTLLFSPPVERVWSAKVRRSPAMELRRLPLGACATARNPRMMFIELSPVDKPVRIYHESEGVTNLLFWGRYECYFGVTSMFYNFGKADQIKYFVFLRFHDQCSVSTPPLLLLFF